MTALFADTFYWIALTDPRDASHEAVVKLTAERGVAPTVTTDEVLAEYLALFERASAAFRIEAGLIVEELLDSPTVRVIPQSRDTFVSGMALHTARPDKTYSLPDCISMQTIRREGLSEALTIDRFTYIKASPEETPALYEIKDGKPNLVNFDYQDGPFVLPKVLETGYLAIRREKLRFALN